MDSPGGVWVPTPDFEIWPLGKGKGRSLVVQPFDDNNPESVIAMGDLTLRAAVICCLTYNPYSVAIAYGDSSPSLQVEGHPSENQVMSSLLAERVPRVYIEAFNSEEWGGDGKLSGTYNEAANLLRLVRRGGFDEIFIVRRQVHLRAIVFTTIRLNEPEFADLKEKVLAGTLRIQETTVEQLLLNSGNMRYEERIEKILNSHSYQRSLLREGNALMNFGKGTTQIVQKPVDTEGLAK
jgi:hypothetical protein